jgi:hypothetical protein
MFKKGDVLAAAVDFDNALFFAVPVEIWQSGKFIDCGGSITKHTEDAVYFGYDDEHYSKQSYQFRVR